MIITDIAMGELSNRFLNGFSILNADAGKQIICQILLDQVSSQWQKFKIFTLVRQMINTFQSKSQATLNQKLGRVAKKAA